MQEVSRDDLSLLTGGVIELESQGVQLPRSYDALIYSCGNAFEFGKIREQK